METTSTRVIDISKVEDNTKNDIKKSNTTDNSSDWVIALWICIILTVLVLIFLWIIVLINKDGNDSVNINYPNFYPIYVVRLLGNSLIIILIAIIAIFINKNQLSFIPIYLILLALIYSCLLIMEISFATNNFSRIALMAAIAFLISLALWLLVDKTDNSSWHYVSYFILIIINIYLLYLTYIMFELWKQN